MRLSPYFIRFPECRAQLSCRAPSFVEDQAVHVVGQIGQRDLGLGAFDADRAADPPLRLELLLVGLAAVWAPKIPYAGVSGSRTGGSESCIGQVPTPSDRLV